MKAIILKPRLDVPFKDFSNGYVPRDRQPIPAIRRHWENFVTKKEAQLKQQEMDVEVIEEPLWRFTQEFVQGLAADFIYIPHREIQDYSNLPVQPLFYMQTVFPWIFYVDWKGFAGGSSIYPFYLKIDQEDNGTFDKLAAYVQSGKSKFDQPSPGSSLGPGKYDLFTCQIPHDMTLQRHSDFSVLDALEMTLSATKELSRTLVVKGHPINQASMAPLKELVSKYTNALWVDNVNIQDAIKNAQTVITVNSGTGMEALLHKKPVATFGRCEYDCVTNKIVDHSDLTEFFHWHHFNESRTRQFFAAWSERTFDTSK